MDNNFKLSGTVGRCTLNGVGIDVFRTTDSVKVELTGIKASECPNYPAIQVYTSEDYELMTERFDNLEGCRRLTAMVDYLFDIDLTS